MIRRKFLKVLAGLPFLGFLKGKPIFQEKKEIFLGSCKISDGLGIMVPRGSTWILTRCETKGRRVICMGVSEEGQTGII